MDDCNGPVFLTLLDPAPLYQQANALWGYAFGLSTILPIAALWRWLRP